MTTQIKRKMVAGLLALSTTTGGLTSPPSRVSRLHVPTLMIRVAQESSPGAADFDTHVLGFVKAFQSDGAVASFYEFHRAGPNYGNAKPVLTANTSHLFFVNGADGLALFVVQNTSNRSTAGARGGSAETRWELSGGTARLLLVDDGIGEATAMGHGTVFTTHMHWAQSNTDGMVIGALPVGFTMVGQFTDAPTGLNGGWEVISDEEVKVPLRLVPRQRVRLDVALQVPVRQDH